MSVSPEVKQEIIKLPELSPIEVVRKLAPKFDGKVTLTMVRQVRQESERTTNIEVAQTEASKNLDKHNTLTIEMQDTLTALFNNAGASTKEKMEISKELRAWTKMGIESAGSTAANGGTIFVIAEEWDIGE